MKAAINENKKAMKVAKGWSPSPCVPGVKKSRRIAQKNHKVTGKGEHFLSGKDKCYESFCATDGLLVEVPHKGKNLSGVTKDLLEHEHNSSQTLHPRKKIKLQLFPIDENIQMGLEKDGYHPYLELTLSAGKKISSVLKHLNSKWGCSNVAVGEPMLCPYNPLYNSSGYKRWTLNDIDTSAGDIYASTGSPATFRLRYGWFSSDQPKASAEPLTSSTPYNFSLKSEGMQGGCSIRDEVEGEDLRTLDIGGQNENIDHGQLSAEWIHNATEISIGGLLSEASLLDQLKNSDPKIRGSVTELQPIQIIYDSKSMATFSDSLTYSIGGLLSEASLQGMHNNSNAKPFRSDGELQSTQIVSDSLDAFISAQRNCLQDLRLPANDVHSSILDAEETCHAFPSRKLSSPCKEVLVLGGSCGQGKSSKTECRPGPPVDVEEDVKSHIDQVSQADVLQDQACKESGTDLLLCSRAYDDERSLGLADIKWSDSLGPFDLGLSSSKKLVSGDNLSVNRFVK